MSMLQYMQDNFNFFIVLGSFVAAVMGSFLALSLARLALNQPNNRDRLWLSVLAGVALGGIGIWSMHFIGMMAYTGGALSYDVPQTVISLLIAVSVVSAGLYMVVVGAFSYGKLVVAGVLVAAGVVAMHYLGMAAIDAELSYNMPIVYASAVIAVVAALAALWLLVNVSGAALMTVSALVMGVAVCGMHYTGMYAVTISGAARSAYGGDNVMLLGMIVLLDMCVLVLAGTLGHLNYKDYSTPAPANA